MTYPAPDSLLTDTAWMSALARHLVREEQAAQDAELF